MSALSFPSHALRAATVCAMVVAFAGPLTGTPSPRAPDEPYGEALPSSRPLAVFAPASLSLTSAEPRTWGASFFSWSAPTYGYHISPVAGDTVRRPTTVRHRVLPRKKREAKLSWAFMGAAVVCGGASMYFKNKADERYERYLRASSPEKMNRYYDEACRLDSYAGLAYGGFQLSFLLWVYFFLRSR